MINFDNKKAPESWRMWSVRVVNKGILTMNNITQFTQDKQVQVSEQQLRSLLEFVRIANNRFDEISALTTVIAEKSELSPTIKTLAHLASSIANNFQDICVEEFDNFKECSPDLVKFFAEELAA